MPAPSKARLRPTLVENPYFSRAHPADSKNPRSIPAMVNVRESAITTLASRGVLDAAQVAAADRFRALFEAMGGKGAGALITVASMSTAARRAIRFPSGRRTRARNLPDAGRCSASASMGSCLRSAVKALRSLNSWRARALTCSAWGWTILPASGALQPGDKAAVCLLRAPSARFPGFLRKDAAWRK